MIMNWKRIWYGFCIGWFVFSILMMAIKIYQVSDRLHIQELEIQCLNKKVDILATGFLMLKNNKEFRRQI